MVGVRPLPDALGRVNKIEPVSLEELGRPRIDVVVNCSGVFRDLFINQVSFWKHIFPLPRDYAKPYLFWSRPIINFTANASAERM